MPYHILNGDALLDRFPSDIKGERLVARECLVDGPVAANSLDELYRLRAVFLTSQLHDLSVEQYYTGSVSEFEKMQAIPKGSTIYAWFEDDLFCQVNFWFVGYLLHHFVEGCTVYLVRPKEHTRFGFGGLRDAQLHEILDQKIEVQDVGQIARLWEFYQQGNQEELLRLACELEGTFPFIRSAVEAHLARIPTAESPGRPVQVLLDIMESLGSDAFGPVFQEFCKREPIYGFGDLQVERLWNEIRQNR